MNTVRALKIGASWVTITYVFCYIVLGSFSGLRESLLPYVLHLNVGTVENVFTLGNFIGGLVLWNVMVAAGISLVGVLARYFKN